MNVPLSNEDIERALRGENGFRGVYSYDLLPNLKQGQFCVVNTDNVLPVWDSVEGGHHWLTVCREKDHVLVFDSFGRSLEQMEQNYTEPKLKQFFLEAFPDCWISTNTQVIQDRSTAVCGRYAILVGRLFSKGGSIENVLQQLGEMFSSDTLANDRSMVEMEGKGKDGKWTDRLAQELHKPRRVRFPRRRVHVKGIDLIWSSDLVDMSAFSKDNHGVKYLLTIIDVFSKYAWVMPLKTKTGKDITKAFDYIIEGSGRKPSRLWVDKGTEFYNKTFKKYLEQNDIQMYSTHNEGKAVVVERFNRTIKTRMWKYFSANSTTRYFDILPALLQQYNHSVHRSTGMTPHDASQKENEEEVRIKLQGKSRARAPKAKFRIGEQVRIAKLKRHFEKGYTPNWTEEVFVVDQVLPTRPVTYKIRDLADEPIVGSFYEQQMQKTTQTTFRIEKVLRKRKGQALVKWKGYPEKFNSWVPLEDLERL